MGTTGTGQVAALYDIHGNLPALEAALAAIDTHATPRSDEEIVTVATPAERVRPMLESVTQAVVICGHTHMQFDRSVDGVRLVNAGSVGMPYGRAGAYWLLLGPDVRHMRSAYDLERAAELVRQTSYPRAADFASRNVLEPDSEADALGLFDQTATTATIAQTRAR